MYTEVNIYLKNLLMSGKLTSNALSALLNNMLQISKENK